MNRSSDISPPRFARVERIVKLAAGRVDGFLKTFRVELMGDLTVIGTLSRLAGLLPVVEIAMGEVGSSFTLRESHVLYKGLLPERLCAELAWLNGGAGLHEISSSAMEVACALETTSEGARLLGF